MRASERDGVGLACLYSFHTNRLGYCGPPNAYKTLESFLKRPTPLKALKAKKLLKEFPGLHAYLETIARANGARPFDYEVVEAYWLGNGLLRSVKRGDLRETILGFAGKGLMPLDKARRRAGNMPKGVVPHHSFHVLYVEFLNPRVPLLLKNLGECLVLPQRVTAVDAKQGSGRLFVSGPSLGFGAKGFKLVSSRRVVDAGPAFEASRGDCVGVHWSMASQVLSSEKASDLERYTLLNVRGVNSLLLKN